MTGIKRMREDEAAEPSAFHRITNAAEQNATMDAARTEDIEAKQFRKDAARDAVFGTSKLLGNILQYLPMKRIFVSQHVCKNFRDAIPESSAVREKLWLKSIAPSKGHLRLRIEGEGRRRQFVEMRPDEEAEKGFTRVHLYPHICQDMYDYFPFPGGRARQIHQLHQIGVEAIYLRREVQDAAFERVLGGPKKSYMDLQITLPECTRAVLNLDVGIGKKFALRIDKGPFICEGGFTVERVMEVAFETMLGEDDRLMIVSKREDATEEDM